MKLRVSVFYLVTLLLLTILIFGVFYFGRYLEEPIMHHSSSHDAHKKINWDSFLQIVKGPVTVFILQLVLIIIVCGICGLLFKKIGQPAVVGEIAAGIILGPSFLHPVLPAVSAFIFPDGSLGNLNMLSQLGLILFMFIIGMEVDFGVIKKKAGSAIMISHASIAIPFGLGVLLSYFLYKGFATPGIPFYAFSLFIGISVSVTAFPVLARILRERGLSSTKLGNIVVACAAVDDITAWCLLAIVLSFIKGGSSETIVFILSMTIIYLMVMIFLVRPLMHRVYTKMNGGIGFALTFVMLFFSAYCSEAIGIHVLFGAFLAGVIMPANQEVRNVLIVKIEDFALIVLLPLFFVYTGLRTQIGLLNSPALWGTCALIVLVAIAGKLGGSALAARFMGESLKESLMIGALMNTRGLVELVVLNIGYDMGILTPELFTMMILMALITTLMTNPLLNLFSHIKR